MSTTTDDVEAVTGEIVERSPQPTSSRSAIERAAEAALADPTIPGRDEFLALAAQARILSMSAGAPARVRGNPHLAFHMALIARDLKVSLAAALRLIDVIPVKDEVQLSLSPELINGVLIREEMGRIVPVHEGVDRCVALALGPAGQDRRCRRQWPVHADDCACDDLGEVEFTWEDARMAGLVADECRPGEHTAKCKNRDTPSYLRCNTGYVTYPRTMLWWRACAFAARRYFPQSTLGMYTSEELGAGLDEQGRMVDPATVELPEGYTPALPPPPPPADVDELWTLQERIHALPADQQAELRDRWGKADRLKGRSVRRLPADSVGLAKSMIAGFESMARRNGHDVDEARAEVRERCAASAVTAIGLAWLGRIPVAAPSEPLDGPEPVGGYDEADSRSEAATAHEEAASVADDLLEADLEAANAAPAKLAERVVAEVKALDEGAVDAGLADAGLEPVGNLEARRMRLAVRWTAGLAAAGAVD